MSHVDYYPQFGEVARHERAREPSKWRSNKTVLEEGFYVLPGRCQWMLFPIVDGISRRR